MFGKRKMSNGKTIVFVSFERQFHILLVIRIFCLFFQIMQIYEG